MLTRLQRQATALATRIDNGRTFQVVKADLSESRAPGLYMLVEVKGWRVDPVCSGRACEIERFLDRMHTLVDQLRRNV